MSATRPDQRRWISLWLFVGVAVPCVTLLLVSAINYSAEGSGRLHPEPLPVVGANWLCVAVPEAEDTWPRMQWELTSPSMDELLFYSVIAGMPPDSMDEE